MKIERSVMILLLLGVLFGLWATTAYAQQTDTLRIDLNTALDIALSENPNMKVADMEITKKQYAKKSAYGTLLPQIDLIGQYQRTLKRQTMYLDGDFNMLGNFDPSKFTPEELKFSMCWGALWLLPREAAPTKAFKWGVRIHGRRA